MITHHFSKIPPMKTCPFSLIRKVVNKAVPTTFHENLPTATKPCNYGAERIENKERK